MTKNDLIEQFSIFQLELIEDLRSYLQYNSKIIHLTCVYPHLSSKNTIEYVTLVKLELIDDNVKVTYKIDDADEQCVNNIEDFAIDELWHICQSIK